jgi:hypothetical protein
VDIKRARSGADKSLDPPRYHLATDIEAFPQLDALALDHRYIDQSMVAARRPFRGKRRRMTSNLSRVAKASQLPANPPEVDFAIVLSRMLDDLKNDPAEMRNAVYELARIKLQREGYLRKPHLSVLEMRRALLALEVAIERVEASHSEADALLVQPSNRLIESQEVIVQRPATHLLDPPQAAEHARVAEHRGSGLRSKWLWVPVLLLQAAATVTLALAVLVILNQQFAFFPFPSGGETIAHATPKTDRQGPQPGAPSPVMRPHAASGVSSASASQPSGLALPTVYGVYASNNGQLHELDVLPGRVPDPRVHVSAAITKPGRTILADGKVVFVVFRRDLATNAPDRVAVRVIAKIVRATKFSAAGQAITTPLDDLWAIRDKSYELRVAPLSDNPEMLVIQPENSDFVFPAGRYGLVLKGQAYDFSVAGPVTESVNCLERVEAVNGTFHAECRKP